MTALAPHSRGFRTRYLNYAELTEQMQVWARQFPDLVHLESTGQSPEGRELWLLTLGADPRAVRPAAWVDGNMHAAELAGSSAALAIAEDFLSVQLGERPEFLPEAVAEALRGVHLVAMPRISPDGAEAVLRTGRYVRSVPRDNRPNRQRARWVARDVDGDGLALLMRVRDEAGEFVESSREKGLLVPREVEDRGPFYKLYPEGFIEGYDGFRVPDPDFLSDNEPDLNRNFPYHWAPEPKQAGAGRFPGSEPESRAVIEAATARPNLYTWLNLHTFGGVLIRPLGAEPDSKLPPLDRALYHQLEAWASAFTGYPTVSGFHQFLYEPEKPLHGDLSDFAYHQRGAFAWVCELWDLFEAVGLPKRERFVDRYAMLDREHLEKLAAWDREHNQSSILVPWRPVEHPQLGAVEVGGLDPRFGIWNPPLARLAEVCRGQSAVYLRTAALCPRVVIETQPAEPVGPGLHRVRALVRNLGYLSTAGVEQGAALSFNEPPQLVASGPGLSVEPLRGRVPLGHLPGWGRGRFAPGAALYFQRGRGNGNSVSVEFLVRGSGELKLSVESCRIGRVERTVHIPS